jgi:leader peptidase (prepilin peptidase)/N-methyltransferase
MSASNSPCGLGARGLGLGRAQKRGGRIAGLVVGSVAISTSLVLVPGTAGLLGAALAVVMTTIAVVDAERFVIPDLANATAMVLGLCHAVVTAESDVAGALALASIRGFALAGVFFLLRALHARWRGREGIGLGDVKLAGVAGVWLDVFTIPIAVEIAALSALVVIAIRARRHGRPLLATTRLPFGLFLAPSIWIAWMLRASVLAPPA